ncbi:MAG: glycosyltransferase family 4 protein [Thermodesulfobacteriota bacterium]
MRVVIACPAVVEYDAVGNDVIEEYRCLKEEGIEAYIYAEKFDDSSSHLISEDCLHLLKKKDTVLVYHHAIHWERGLELFKNAACRKVVKYHNITPEHFFLPYSSNIFKNCLLARKQTGELLGAGIDLALFDSHFNALDFLSLGFPPERCRILAPFNRIHEYEKIKSDISVLERLSDGKVNVLFTGRVAPNKGHRHILYTAYYYKLLFGNNVRFTIVGGKDFLLNGYYRELKELRGSLQIDDIVEMTGTVSYEELKSYYLASHIFLLMSEHEGFCVPVLEAQYFKLPIIAFASSAVKETAGKNQLIYNSIDYETFASSIHTLYNDPGARMYLADEGHKNFQGYERDGLKNLFLSQMGEC